METIKFYTDNNKYMGWVKKREYKRQFLSLKSWIISGNYIVYNKQIINKVNHILNIYGFNI